MQYMQSLDEKNIILSISSFFVARIKILSYRRDQYNFINADSDSTTAGSLDILIQFGNIWNQQKSAGRTFHLLDTTTMYY